MTTGAETIEVYRPGDEEEINEMYNEVFRSGRSLEEWRWKFQRNPFPELTMIRKLMRGDRMIGHCGSLPGEFKVGGRRLYGGQIVDHLIRPPFQRQKNVTFLNRELSLRMKNAFIRHGIAFGFGFPNELSYPIFMKYLEEAEDVMEVPIWRKRLGSPALPGAWGGGGLRRLVRAIRSRGVGVLGGRGRREGPGPGGDFEIRELADADPRHDALWEACSREIGIACVRDRRYVAWRFFDKPGRPYAFRLLEKKGTPAGYVVTSILEGETRFGYIMDILWRPGEDILGTLLDRTMAQMERDEIDMVECLAVRDSPLARALEGLGFRAEPRGVKMIVLLLEIPLDRAYFFDPGNWHITLGDMDGT